MIRAFAFALIINLQTILVLFQIGPLSPFAFSGVDESSYLPLSGALASGRPETRFYKELDIPKNVSFVDSPTAFLDYCVGRMGIVFDLPLAGLGLLLDLLCGFFAYLLFSKLYRQFLPQKYLAEIATILTLVQPKLLTLDYWFVLSPHLGEHIFNVPIGTTSALAVSRAVYTQISYLVFPLVLILLVQYLSKKENFLPLILSGLLAGLCIHIYVFAWIASCALTICIVCIMAIIEKLSARALAKELLILCASICCSSLIGLYSIFWGSSGAQLVSAEQLRDYWYFSPELTVLSLLVLYVLYTTRSLSRTTRILGCVLLACLLLQLGLMNLQGILGVFVSPFRIAQLYLQPLATGALSIFCFRFLLRFQSKLLTVCMSLVFLIVAFWPLFQRQAIALELASHRIETPLAQYIISNTNEDAVIAIWPSSVIFENIPEQYPLRLRPNMMFALTGRYLLSQNWIMFKQVTTQEIAERELLQSWLFTGRLREAFSCEQPTQWPGDIFNLTWTMNLVAREKVCQAIKTTPKNICQLLEKYQVDYLLFDIPEMSLTEDIRNMTERVWSSTDNQAVLYRFARKRFLSENCE